MTAEQAERELIYRTLLVLGTELSEIKRILIENYRGEQRYIPDEKSRFREHVFEEEIPFKENNEYGEISIKNSEKELIKKALLKYKSNRKKAAKELGISERTLYRKLKELNL